MIYFQQYLQIEKRFISELNAFDSAIHIEFSPPN